MVVFGDVDSGHVWPLSPQIGQAAPCGCLRGGRGRGRERGRGRTARFWKDAFRSGRVIVPADAIFEWKEMPKGQKKQKYEFTLRDQEPFGMAGVWKPWKNPKTEQWERTFAIITGEPNELMQPIHDRMTTFLEPRDYAEYLEPSGRVPLHLLRILPADQMRATLVGPSTITHRQVGLFDSQ